MSGILYLLALIAVPWLVAWTIWDRARPSSIWWPFDMQGDDPPAAPGQRRSPLATRAPRAPVASWRDRRKPEPKGRPPAAGRGWS